MDFDIESLNKRIQGFMDTSKTEVSERVSIFLIDYLKEIVQYHSKLFDQTKAETSLISILSVAFVEARSSKLEVITMRHVIKAIHNLWCGVPPWC